MWARNGMTGGGAQQLIDQKDELYMVLALLKPEITVGDKMADST